MASSFAKLVDNLSEGIHIINILIVVLILIILKLKMKS